MLFFCGNEADEQKENKKCKDVRKTIRHVSIIGFKENVIKIADKRRDALAKVVKKRIIFEIDLIAAEAKYHDCCFVKFHLPTTGKQIGRPLDGQIIAAMENIFSYIENNDDCQFTFTELKGVLEDFKPDDKTIRKKLQERYGDRIVITNKNTGPSIVCFRYTQYDILNKTWYESKKQNPEEERFRVLAAAATILRQDMHSQVCETDYYSPSSTMFDDVNSLIPQSLTFFMEEIILKNKKGKLEFLKKNVSQSVMLSCLQSVPDHSCLLSSLVSLFICIGNSDQNVCLNFWHV